MARMRSLKPEYWDDEELATTTTRDARLLYPGLWNLADEHGRLRGDPRYIKGKIFAYDDDLTPAAIDALIDQLARIGKVVRYRVGGARYLYLPRLAKHQRLEADKVPSRLPAPEETDPDPPPEQPEPPRANKSAPDPDESAPGAKDHALKHVAGSREHVAGIPPSAGVLALVPSGPAPSADNAQALIGEWIDHCRKRPPAPVIGQVGKHVKALLAEGIDPADVRAGLAAWWRKGLHPSTLPSIVNEVMNAVATQSRASTRPSGDIDWDAAMQRAQAREAAQ